MGSLMSGWDAPIMDEQTGTECYQIYQALIISGVSFLMLFSVYLKPLERSNLLISSFFFFVCINDISFFL
jgi:hypothetical protein